VLDNLTQQTYRRAKKLIPGGTQLLSKRPEMHAPGRWPGYYREARGCQIVDLDGREYCDMTTSGIGACLLGYADPDVNDAVIRRVQNGTMCSLNAVEEVELAELLVSLHPWAEQVRYCRTGGESMAAAVRIARAAKNRDVIAFCGYHGWSDWYLAANLPNESREDSPSRDPLAGHLLPGLCPNGVPRSLAGTSLPFSYNRLDELERLASSHKSRLAAVVLEPFRVRDPEPGFFEGVRAVCDWCDAVLIVDEITTGWRFGLGGCHLNYNLRPDISVFAKALGNGHPIGAILGTKRVMEAAQSTFLSSTYWSEAVGPTAALATIRKLQHCDVPAHVDRIGNLVREGLLALGKRHVLPLKIEGRGGLLHIDFAHPLGAEIGTLFTVLMLDRGFLAGNRFYPTLAHQRGHVDAFLAATDDVYGELALAVREGNLEKRLGGRVRQSGFARLT
jgi:glutamate-1-semialdehyde 2,1-aminomutase